MTRRERVLDEIHDERERQIELKHGGDTDAFDAYNSVNDWVAYITAYAGRAAAKAKINSSEPHNFRTYMIKVAALAVAAIEAYDKRMHE